MTIFNPLKRWLAASSMGFALATAGVIGLTNLPEPANAAGMLTPKGQSSSLKIADHQVNVTIEDGYAITRVDQRFLNPQGQDLDAVYSFPVPEAAAVSGFTVWIDGKPVLGEVFEKQKARQIHEQEKQRGRDTGLAEKNSYKTFELSVSPVRANSETRLSLTYLQPIKLDGGVGRFLYPLEDGGVDAQQASFWRTNDTVEKFSFDMTIKSAVPVDAVRMPGYQASVVQQNVAQWTVSLDKRAPDADGTAAGEGAQALQQSLDDGLVHAESLRIAPQTSRSGHQLNKDLVVYWRLAPNLPASVDMVNFKPEANGRGTFMMVLTPGNELKKIVRGTDWTFVVDMSGSMKGKFETVMQGLTLAFERLQATDRVRVIGFNRNAWDVSGGFVNATSDTTQHLIDKLRRKGPDGGTNLYAGLSQAISSLDSDRTNSIVLVTDGVANVGRTEQSAFLSLVNQRDIRLFTMIMGNSANRPLLNNLTDASGGFAISVSNADDVVGQMLKAVDKVSHEALHNIQITASGVRIADIVRSRDSSLYYGDQLVLFGHYWGNGEATLKIDAQVSGQPRRWNARFSLPATATDNPEIERLWAFSTVEKLKRDMDRHGKSDDTKSAIIDIATNHSIVTDYTSMVVMSEQAYAERGIERRNQARTQVENTAQKNRAQRAAVSRRVDQPQATFQGNRQSTQSGSQAGGNGAGNVTLLWLLLMAAALMADTSRRFTRRANHSQ